MVNLKEKSNGQEESEEEGSKEDHKEDSQEGKEEDREEEIVQACNEGPVPLVCVGSAKAFDAADGGT